MEKRRIKAAASFVLALGMVLSAAGCSSENTAASGTSAASEAVTDASADTTAADTTESDAVGKYERNQESVQRSYDFANILNSSFQQSSYPSKSSVQLNNSNNHLTKYSRVPTILLEAGFMTNTNDLQLIPP